MASGAIAKGEGVVIHDPLALFLFTLRTTLSRQNRRESKNGSSLGRLVEPIDPNTNLEILSHGFVLGIDL